MSARLVLLAVSFMFVYPVWAVDAQRGWMMYGGEDKGGSFLLDDKEDMQARGEKPRLPPPTASAVEQLRAVERQREWDRTRAVGVGNKDERVGSMLEETQRRIEEVLKEVRKRKGDIQ